MSARRAVIALRCAAADEWSASTGITPSMFIVAPIGIDRSVSKLDHALW